MIKTKTLFILGAGASAPFKYPTSVNLRYDILYNNLYDTDIVSALNKGGDNFFAEPYHEHIKKFRDAFTKSGVYSIDSFLEHLDPSLEHRTEFMDIGKIFIARMLISYEIDNNLRVTEKNWYMYLFDRLKVSFGQLDQNNISFITFNYDRSLEYFLFEAIKNQFGKESTECTEMMKIFPIVHLYGQLDPLPWQEPDGKEYSSTENLIERLRSAPENIKLISDERGIEKNEYFQNAHKLIKGAERIFILGFSFDETNLGRLQVEHMQNKSIIATACGLEGSMYRWVEKYFAKRSCTSMNLVNADALSLLQEHLEIE